MHLTVRLFSLLRERVGRSRLEVTVADGSTGIDVLDYLASQYPVIREMKSTIRLAVNDAYVSGAEALADGDEIALLTPVSGG